MQVENSLKRIKNLFLVKTISSFGFESLLSDAYNCNIAVRQKTIHVGGNGL